LDRGLNQVSVTVPPRAARLIERLSGIAAAYAEPRADTGAVEAAVQDHLERLGLERRPVRFVSDFADARRSAVTAALGDGRWVGTWRAAWRQACGEAWRFRVEWSTARRLAEVSARRVLAAGSWRRVQALLRRDLGPDESRWASFHSALEWVEAQALCDAIESAVEAVSWSAEPAVSPAIDRWLELLSPLVDAFEAGLWLCWMTPSDVRAVLRPAAKFQRGWLHAEGGPAITWSDGRAWYVWRGVRVPKTVVLQPFSLTVSEIADERDIEVRRVMLERYGPERFIQEIDATLVDADKTGTLYRQELRGDEPLCMVHVFDATPLPDGSRRSYWLRVPPTVHTAREAVAWTFGMDSSRYRPTQET
jgi:hypothetical protein